VTPVTDSSVPAADGRDPAARRWRRDLAEPIALALVVGAMAAVMFASHRAGHWWGDDWALYLRQADGLVSGRPGRVLTENELAVTLSRGPAFSPPLYPWGFPLVLAPFVAAWGTDIDRLAAVQVLAASAFACAWYLLARVRVGVVPALVGTVAITISPLLLGWTELIQSEWTFLAVATAALAVLDRASMADRLVGPGARWRTLLTIGLLAAAAFSVRREGLALVAAIGAAQVGPLVAMWRRDRRIPPVRHTLACLVVPHAVALAAVWLLQTLLPTTVIPRYRGTSVWNTWRFREEHVDHLLEIVGLKRPWEADPTVFGNAIAGWVAAAVFLALALAGVVWGLARRADVHLVAYAVTAFVIGASFRVPVNRYLATVAPVLLLLGLSVVTRVVDRAGRRWATVALATLAVGAIAAGNVANAHLRIDRASHAATAGLVEWGPTHPDALAMFAEVRARTGRDDIVAAPKARAMTFATDRLAVQVDDDRPVPAIDLALVVVERTSDLHRRLFFDPAYETVWSNRRFTIFRPTG
jgi:hypothetical protein